MTETWNAELLAAYIRDQYGEDAASTTEKINRWLARGDGVAVYENCELGHPELGWPRLASYGSPSALLEAGFPPVQLPDTTQHINWRYRLKATYRGEPLGER